MSWRGSVCLILFNKPGFGQDDAYCALSACGNLCVTLATGGHAKLAVQTVDGPVLMISFQAGPATQRWIAPSGKHTRHAVTAGQCDACFFISLDDLSSVLKNSSGLLSVQKTLLEATQGLLYTLWDDELRSVTELAA